MERYYMLSDKDIPDFMEQTLKDTYKRMAEVKTANEFNQLLKDAPAFIFDNINDFIQACRADSIVILVPPNNVYEFDILYHDPERSRIVVNSMERIDVSEEEFIEIVMDYYPIDASL